ncbi:MAG TPA: (p)ppGpp synthetase, partial [Ruminococcaceae bacterium]|nr:(p)ppGpp synthetase [Oscillospiraceae bacterium]
NRFKDYISTPKPNMYQSLHTTVIGKDGIPFEIQIRTWEMHHTAEYGIAAHWKYKLGMTNGKPSRSGMEKRLAWIREILEEQKNSTDATDLIHIIKSDLTPDEVYVFTPRGDVINLPSGSTVIDFAYAIHSAIGNRMVGAKVDKRIVPLTTKLKTGQIVDIITSKETHGPSRDWLKIVKTSEARNKIRTWFKKEKRDENIVEGQNEVEREFKRNGISLSA